MNPAIRDLASVYHVGSLADMRAIQDFADALRASGRTLLLCGAPSQPAKLMHGAEFHRHLGDRNILPSVDAALARAAEIHSGLSRTA